ncbi:hypothetical protein NFI95_16275 [Acetobacteraceae bacterium KSS8]|uniref:Uncharacterized protein n=1 Tax=Endosaccharibacter trunci TaxID=2812733 RepID=A0ABT1WAS9_9PROT|nr:hypothetical protein [Acetobacteraceae bacterium KSS8]
MDTRSPTGPVAVALAAAGGMTVLGMALSGAGLRRSGRRVAARANAVVGAADRRTAVTAARRLNRASGTLAASVLFDSAVEHYRGGFHNKAMYTPLVAATLSLLVSAHGHRDRGHDAELARDLVYAGAGLAGLLGTGFHVFNVGKKPGGFGWQNLFYSAPLGAPAALCLSGLLGWLSERVRDNAPDTAPLVLGIPAGRVVGAATAAGIIGTVAEAGLLHLRGQFHDPFMLLPVTVPPVAAGFCAAAAFGGAGRPRPLARWMLRASAVIGLSGSAFHAIGVARSMGGWRNWRQNLLDGPPLPAPPAFTGLALAGLAALSLLEDQPE